MSGTAAVRPAAVMDVAADACVAAAPADVNADVAGLHRTVFLPLSSSFFLSCQSLRLCPSVLAPPPSFIKAGPRSVLI